jgi:glycosyltransferase involved in cell wall biosynthesis
VGYAGTDRVAQLFTKYLKQRGNYDPYIVYRLGNHDNSRLDIMKDILGEDRVVGYLWEPGRSGKTPPYIPESSNLKEVLAAIQPDIVHMHRSGYAEWPGMKSICPGAKFVETNIFGYNDATNPRQFDYNIYISNFIKNSALNAGNQDGPVLYNPTEQPVLEMTEENRRECRERLLRRFGMPDDAVLMGRVGRPDNFDPIALNAFKKIQGRVENLHYLVVNPCGRWREVVDRQRIERVHFLDPIIADDELSAFYHGLDFYAHARQDGECCPCNIQEAMMHGLPILSHHSPIYNGQSEIIENGGFCVPINDDTAYGKVMEQLALRPDVREHFGRDARRRAMRDFEASCVTDKLERMYSNVLSK